MRKVTLCMILWLSALFAEGEYRIILPELEVPDKYKMSAGERDTTLAQLLSDFGSFSHSSEEARIVMQVDSVHFYRVSKMAGELGRMEINGRLGFYLGKTLKKSIPFQGRAVEEGESKAFREALNNVNWDTELIQKWLNTFRNQGGIVKKIDDSL